MKSFFDVPGSSTNSGLVKFTVEELRGLGFKSGGAGDVLQRWRAGAWVLEVGGSTENLNRIFVPKARFLVKNNTKALLQMNPFCKP